VSEKVDFVQGDKVWIIDYYGAKQVIFVRGYEDQALIESPKPHLVSLMNVFSDQKSCLLEMARRARADAMESLKKSTGYDKLAAEVSTCEKR
jgi:hypothetical protein